MSGDCRICEDAMTEWHGTADIPLPEWNSATEFIIMKANISPPDDSESASVPYREELLQSTNYPIDTIYPYSDDSMAQISIDNALVEQCTVVTLPSAEVELLTRIAETADEYGRKRLWELRKELFRLLKQWRREWRR